MVRTSIGIMEWGIDSFSDDDDDDEFNLLFNQIVPPTGKNPDGTRELSFGLRLGEGISSKDRWEKAYYSPQGFQRALLARQKEEPLDNKYRPIREQDLQAPAPLRYALRQLAVELDCLVWYRLNLLHVGIVIDEYRDPNFEADAFITWLGQRLDQLIVQFPAGAA